MDTKQQALFRQMMLDGWFTKSDGDTDAITGYFGYVSNEPNELQEIREAFSEIIELYGHPDDEDIVGHFFCVIDTCGTFHIFREPSNDALVKRFKEYSDKYAQWIGA